jgi:predicted porin
MKKTLVAIAALAAFGAQAQSTVTLYGVADIAYGAKTIENSTGVVQQKQTGVMDGGFAGNRIGFKGTEDLGGGQAVGFNIEQGISPTNGALFGVRTANAGMQLDGYAANTGKFDQGTGGGYSQGTNRQSFVSFSDKNLGEVRAGYQYAAVYEVSTLMGFTTMSEGVMGGSSSHTHGAGAVGGTRANGIQYIAPRMGAFGVAVQAGSAAGRDTTEFATATVNTANGQAQARNKRFSLKLDFEQGPWKAAYAKTDFANATGAAASMKSVGVYGALTDNATTATTATAYNATLNQLAGSYTGSNWKVGYQRNSGTYSQTIENTGTVATYAKLNKVGDYDIKSQRISGMYTIGKWDLIAGQGTSTVDSADAVRQMDLKEKQIGALYNLSKRSRVYAYQGQWTDSATQATTNTKGKQTIVGLAHSF